jgi:DNA-binding Xre family transcriptional regulator
MACEIDERLIELAKQQMAYHQWNQKVLADKMGIDESEISLLLGRKRRWSLKLIQAFSQATGLVVCI